ncbi:hypothetical protein [Shinella sp.]|uniref:hypothetical protein n=1 Tax=Shinella sp. TaxID=1870904 RepID=UPI00301DFA47
MPNTPIQATGEAMPEMPEERDALDVILEAGTKLDTCRSLTHLIFMTGEALIRSDRNTGNAITTCCDMIDNMLDEASDFLSELQGKLKSTKTGRNARD